MGQAELRDPAVEAADPRVDTAAEVGGEEVAPALLQALPHRPPRTAVGTTHIQDTAPLSGGFTSAPVSEV